MIRHSSLQYSQDESNCRALLDGCFTVVAQNDAIRTAEEADRERKRLALASEVAAAAAAEYLSNKRCATLQTIRRPSVHRMRT